jgi:hypothetical protein
MAAALRLARFGAQEWRPLAHGGSAVGSDREWRHGHVGELGEKDKGLKARLMDHRVSVGSISRVKQ